MYPSFRPSACATFAVLLLACGGVAVTAVGRPWIGVPMVLVGGAVSVFLLRAVTCRPKAG